MKSSKSFKVGPPVGSVSVAIKAQDVSGDSQVSSKDDDLIQNSLQILFDGEMKSDTLEMSKIGLDFRIDVNFVTNYWELKGLVLDYEVKRTLTSRNAKLG